MMTSDRPLEEWGQTGRRCASATAILDRFLRVIGRRVARYLRGRETGAHRVRGRKTGHRVHRVRHAFTCTSKFLEELVRRKDPNGSVLPLEPNSGIIMPLALLHTTGRFCRANSWPVFPRSMTLGRLPEMF